VWECWESPNFKTQPPSLLPGPSILSIPSLYRYFPIPPFAGYLLFFIPISSCGYRGRWARGGRGLALVLGADFGGSSGGSHLRYRQARYTKTCVSSQSFSATSLQDAPSHESQRGWLISRRHFSELTLDSRSRRIRRVRATPAVRHHIVSYCRSETRHNSELA
jgi:hypothetical protein